MLRMLSKSHSWNVEDARVLFERRPAPDKDERLSADTGLDHETMRKAVGRPVGDASHDARLFHARSLALDGLR